MKFTLNIYDDKNKISPNEIGYKLLHLGRILMTNRQLIDNLKKQGGSGKFTDKDGNIIGEWVCDVV